MNTTFHSKQQFWCAVYLEALQNELHRRTSVSPVDQAVLVADKAIRDYEERFGDLEPGAARL
jgi:hypothetical protein